MNQEMIKCNKCGIHNLPSETSCWNCNKEGICDLCNKNETLYHSNLSEKMICKKCEGKGK